jgi:hypothetical protein
MAVDGVVMVWYDVSWWCVCMCFFNLFRGGLTETNQEKNQKGKKIHTSGVADLLSGDTRLVKYMNNNSYDGSFLFGGTCPLSTVLQLPLFNGE